MVLTTAGEKVLLAWSAQAAGLLPSVLRGRGGPPVSCGPGRTPAAEEEPRGRSAPGDSAEGLAALPTPGKRAALLFSAVTGG